MHPNLLPHILQLQTASIWFCSPAATASFPFLSFPAAAGYQSVALSVPVAFLSSHQAATQFYSPYPTLIQSLSSFQITSIWKNSPKPISRNSRPPEPRGKNEHPRPKIKTKIQQTNKQTRKVLTATHVTLIAPQDFHQELS